MAFMLSTMAINCFTTDCLKEKADIVVTYDKVLNMSLDENLVVIVLDTADGTKVAEFLNENEKCRKILKDFAFYPNTVGAYTWTSFSIPQMLSGEWYEGNEDFLSYKERVYTESELFNFLRERNYDIGLYTTEIPQSSVLNNRFVNIIESDTSRFETPFGFIKLQIKLVGLKYFPYVLKGCCEVTNEYIYNYSLKKTSNQNTFNWENGAFLDIINNTEVTENVKNSFRFIHIMGPHYPYEANEDINGLGEGSANYLTSLEASFDVLNVYFEKLKSSGVYDNTAIVLLGDHGFEENVVFRQNPMFMVKGMKDCHDFVVSDKPVSYSGIIDYFERLTLGQNVESALEDTDNSENGRRFLSGSNPFYEYYQTGKAWNTDTMIPTGMTCG